MKGILGTKVGMTQVWEDDRLVPVTVLLAGPCPVVQRKTSPTDGYEAVQIGWDEVKDKAINKPLKGHFQKNDVSPQRHLVELRNYAPEGDEVTVEIFEAGETVDVRATSKGRGFAGVMKRWNFSGGDASHGAKKNHRKGGSIGQSTTPGRVYKGKKMPGRYGSKKASEIGLRIVEVRPEDNLILVKGSVPGPNGGVVLIRESGRKKGN